MTRKRMKTSDMPDIEDSCTLGAFEFAARTPNCAENKDMTMTMKIQEDENNMNTVSPFLNC